MDSECTAGLEYYISAAGPFYVFNVVISFFCLSFITDSLCYFDFMCSIRLLSVSFFMHIKLLHILFLPHLIDICQQNQYKNYHFENRLSVKVSAALKRIAEAEKTADAAGRVCVVQ